MALSSCLYELCNFLGENPIDFLERNNFYFNRKLERRKNYFLNVAILKNLKEAENNCSLPDTKYKIIMAEITNLLKKENLIRVIIKEISDKKATFDEKFLYELIIPLKERENSNELKLSQLFKFYMDNFSKINQEDLITTFLNKLFNPNKFFSLNKKLFIYSKSYLTKFYPHLIKKLNIFGSINNPRNIEKFKTFINKHYVEKLKIFDKKQQTHEMNELKIIV